MENCKQTKNKILNLLKNPCVTSRIKKMITQTYTVQQNDFSDILMSTRKMDTENSSGFSSANEDIENCREKSHHVNIIHKQSIFTIYESKHSNSKIAKIAPVDESLNETQGMTFQVDTASTPKKTLPRCSTPKTKNLTKIFFKDLTSNPVEKKRKISHQTSCEMKAKVSSKKRCLAQRQCKSVKKEKSCKKCCRKQQLINPEFYQVPIGQPQFVVANLQNSACAASWNKLKYPIRFYPNIRSQDIDRVYNGASMMQDGFNLIPSKTGYDCGDYKVWVL